jgi:hypothetical protein
MKKMMLSMMAAALLFQTNAFADNKTDSKTTMPGMSQEQMAEMMKLGSPSDAHKKLDAFVGKWDYTAKMWMDPAQKKPEVMKGSTDNNWILDGRFIQQHAKGEAMNGMPAFEGVGTTGYDNVKQVYTSSWMDNMSTGTMTATASFDDKTKTLNEKGTYSCPIAKDTKPFRATWKIEGKDAYKYIWYTTDANGKEFKSMEIAYTRTK